MMGYLQAAAGLAAVILAAAPQLASGWTHLLTWAWEPRVSPETPDLLPIAPNYQQSMQHLASVRLRLVRTATLAKDASEAVETLTLALLAGSDK
jgi:hypothetical protein